MVRRSRRGASAQKYIYIYGILFPTKLFQSSYWLIYRLHIHGLPIYSFRNPNPINSWVLMDLSWIFPSFSICFLHRHSCNPLQWPLCSSSLKVSTARCQQLALAMPCSSPLQVCLASFVGELQEWSHQWDLREKQQETRGVTITYCICLVSCVCSYLFPLTKSGF